VIDQTSEFVITNATIALNTIPVFLVDEYKNSGVYAQRTER